ncbi:MAG TPA: GNAT family N-acetyltransferase [Actinocrinis sp.]|nr:GNAT family N-acetyltransferase [Actinocrinis sp.]
MAKLELPDVHVHKSFLAAMAEFQTEGRGAEDDLSMVGGEIRQFSETWHTPEGFGTYLTQLRSQADSDGPRSFSGVPCTTYWWVDGDEYLGRIAIRHELNDALREEGGHIGFDVRPTARQQGHASAMLRAALTVCSSLGIEEALLTCVLDNAASRKVIEANGGVLQSKDHSEPRLRFLINIEANKTPDISPYHATLPLGRRFEPSTDIRDWSIFPYEIDLPPQVRVLEPPSLPEWDRHGESNPAECSMCAAKDEDSVWTDQNWRITAPKTPRGAPIVLFLEPRGHWDMADLPADRAAELGPLFQRIERAILGLGGIGRVHINRWGDGAAHLHWWFIARPAGMPQFRGSFMPLWDVVLPPVEESLWRAK